MPTTDRRQFLGLLTASGAGILGSSLLAESTNAQAEPKSQVEPTTDLPLVDSAPVLQCPTPNGMTVVWAIRGTATGWIEFGTDKNKLDQIAYGDVLGLKPFEDRLLQIRIEELKPNTEYYYRTATCPFRFITGYRFERGEPIFGEVFSFTTPGVDKETGSFSVVNDTHQNQKTLKMLTDRLPTIGSDYTVWNGDMFNTVDSQDMVVESVIRPANSPFATEKPVLFTPGNHDYRGQWARNLCKAIPTWPNVDLADQITARNYTVRTGPLALIGMDTGEDKPDNRTEWAGMVRFEPYRVAQTAWLKRALERPEIKSAPFLVVFCHIPLFDPRPNANPGDLPEGFASYQRQCANLWSPILKEHGVQLVVCAHQHRFRYDGPTSDRPWSQVIGGGHSEKEQVTIIHALADKDKLELVVDELRSDKELGRWTFAPRKI